MKKNFLLIVMLTLPLALFSQTKKQTRPNRAEIDQQIQELMKAREEMFRSLMDDSAFDNFDNFDSNFNNLIQKFQQANGMNMEMGQVVGEYDWKDTEKEKILILKVKQIKDHPLDIKIEKGRITLKGDVQSESSSKDSKQVSQVHFERMFSIPEGVDQKNPQFENVGDELHIKFKKNVPSKSLEKEKSKDKTGDLPSDRQPIVPDSKDMTI